MSSVSVAAQVVERLPVVLGWCGAALVLIAYACMMAGWWSSGSARYLAANLAGAFGLGVSALQVHAWQSLVTNLVWLAFGVHPLLRALQVRALRRRADSARPEHAGDVFLAS